jgi:hypothetical protein
LAPFDSSVDASFSDDVDAPKQRSIHMRDPNHGRAPHLTFQNVKPLQSIEAVWDLA